MRQQCVKVTLNYNIAAIIIVPSKIKNYLLRYTRLFFETELCLFIIYFYIYFVYLKYTLCFFPKLRTCVYICI